MSKENAFEREASKYLDIKVAADITDQIIKLHKTTVELENKINALEAEIKKIISGPKGL